MDSSQTVVNELVLVSDKIERDRLRKKNQRINLNTEQKNVIRRKDVDRKRKRNTNETENERLCRLEKEAKQKKNETK